MKVVLKCLNKIKESKVAKNTIWIISERVLQMIISLVVGVISARYLGPSNYGTLNYGASLINIFSAITKLGLDSIIIKEYIDKKEKNGEILGTAMVMRLISSLFSVIMILILVLIMKPNNNTILVVTLLQSTALFFQIYELIDFWFQARLQSKYVAIAKSTAYIIVAIYKITLLILKKPVEWFAFSTALDYIIIFIIMILMYKKSKGQSIRFSKTIAKKLIKNSYHFILSGLMVTIYTQMDKLMIGNMLDEEQVGLYSIATAICVMWGFIPEALINSIRPTIYEAKKTDEELYLIKLKQLYAIIFWIGIFFALGITIFSKLIINILYGKEYLAARKALIIAVWYTGLSYLGSARGTWIVCENKNKYVKKYIIYGAIVNLILNSILIPTIGICGAAIATLVTQIVVVLMAPLLYKETRISTKYMLDGILLKGVIKNDKKQIEKQ